MRERSINARTALALAAIAVVLFVLPFLLNVLRGGAGGVGVDPKTAGSNLVFAVTYAPELSQVPLRGRFYLIVSRIRNPEPRTQVAAGAAQPYVFAHDVGAWRPGTSFELTDADGGAPLPSIAHIPAGYYWVQGVLDLDAPTAGDLANVRASGSPIVELLTGGWVQRPGNPASQPVELYVDPRGEDVLRVHLARRIVSTGSGGQ
jgi:hypothetical protein